MAPKRRQSPAREWETKRSEVPYQEKSSARRTVIGNPIILVIAFDKLVIACLIFQQVVIFFIVNQHGPIVKFGKLVITVITVFFNDVVKADFVFVLGCLVIILFGGS